MPHKYVTRGGEEVPLPVAFALNLLFVLMLVPMGISCILGVCCRYVAATWSWGYRIVK